MDNAEIGRIQQQFVAGLWPKFIESVSISGLRGWVGQDIRFSFPVSVIVGENGTGKSTILKSLACAYENERKKLTFYPSNFFFETPWDKVSNVTMNFTVRQGTNTTTYNLKKPLMRWSIPERRPIRDVFLLDVSRTLPLDATAGYAKIARQASQETSTIEISEEFTKHLSHILGREYVQARFALSDIDAKREVGLLKRSFGEISQYHQGAGEDTTLDLIKKIQSIPDTSLLLIDEVEASLHPRAQRRLMRFLVHLSRRKRLQIIVSTHSPYILEEIPQEARILLLPSNNETSIVYGASPDFALSRIDEHFRPELHIFVEDREAEIFLREILVSDLLGQEIISRILIVPVGPANVVETMGKLARENKLPYKSIAVIDGDQPPSSYCLSLPGRDLPPERVVFEDLKSKNWPELPQRFGIGAGSLFGYLEDAMLESDHHKWTELVGNKVYKSRISVWEILTNQWCKSCLDQTFSAAFASSINDCILET